MKIIVYKTYADGFIWKSGGYQQVFKDIIGRTKMTQPDKNIIHWKAGLLALNPEMIKEHAGLITKVALFERPNQDPFLGIHVVRDKDKFSSGLTIMHEDMYEDETFSTPEEIERYRKEKGITAWDEIRTLYRDFSVSDYSQLVQRRVTGLYFEIPGHVNEHIIGIRKL